MSFMNNLYNKDEKDKKFRLTRGKLILFAIGIILIIVIIIFVIWLYRKITLKKFVNKVKNIPKKISENIKNKK